MALGHGASVATFIASDRRGAVTGTVVDVTCGMIG
jgi:hypothetical protein